jgi:hypothetical protein
MNNSISDVTSGRPTAVITLTIGRFLFTTASLSKSNTFAFVVVLIERNSYHFPHTHVSAPPSKILKWYFSGRKVEVDSYNYYVENYLC